MAQIDDLRNKIINWLEVRKNMRPGKLHPAKYLHCFETIIQVGGVRRRLCREPEKNFWRYSNGHNVPARGNSHMLQEEAAQKLSTVGYVGCLLSKKTDLIKEALLLNTSGNLSSRSILKVDRERTYCQGAQ